MEIAAIIAAVQAGVQLAPKVIELAAAAKLYFSALFSAGKIDKKTQDDLHKWVDDHLLAHLEGRTPPHWQVQPDPTDVQ